MLPASQPIQPPLHIYKNVHHPLFKKFVRIGKYFERPLSFLSVDEYHETTDKNRKEFLAKEDPEVLKIIEASENITIYDPMWWAQVYRCFTVAPYIAYLHLLDVGEKETIWVIEAGSDHWYYSVGHPMKSTSIFCDPQEAVYVENGIGKPLPLFDYRFKSFKEIKISTDFRTDFDRDYIPDFSF